MKVHGSARWGLLGATLALTAGALAIVPGVADQFEEPIEAAGSTFVETGKITIDGANITYPNNDTPSSTQGLANGQGCRIETDGTLLAFGGGDKSVGFVDGSIGVKSKGNGQDCGQIDGTEALTIDLGTATALDDQAIYQADLDIEVLQDAGVTATISFVDGTKTVELDSFTLASGSAAPPEANNTPESTTAFPEAFCNPQSSSGPNAGDADNCFWTIISDTPFNRLVLTENAGGKASLQGGGDWPSEGPGGPSVLYLTDAPDGILACGDQESVGDATLGGVITRLDDDPSDPVFCELKPYQFQVGADTVEFEPTGDAARYSAGIVKTVDAGQPIDPSDWIEIDETAPFDNFVDMEWCVSATVTNTIVESTDTDIPSFLEPGDVLRTVEDAELPPGVGWCVAAVDVGEPVDTDSVDTDSVAPLDADKVTATFWLYGEDDPHWR